MGPLAYDILRFILPDAIERAGTIETDAVIEALEQTSIETSQARNFVFTESHDAMMGENPNDPDADYMLVMLFQWQNGEAVPVYPKKIMEEAGATYTYPDWPGPWD
jgi:branched-chain amino acid transport system substrate-binding protein